MNARTGIAKTDKPFALNGWHVLWIVVAFFAAVMTVDIGMAVKAYATYPGEVSETPFEDGLAFNQTLANHAEERALGWKAKLQVTVADVGKTRLRLTVLDRTGAPIRDLKLTGILERPATEQGRLQLVFTPTAPGVYDSLAPDTPGAWDLTLKGRDPAGHVFDAERRMVWR